MSEHDHEPVAPAKRWALYCGGDYMYSTTDQEDAQSWVDADPQGHVARPVTP